MTSRASTTKEGFTMGYRSDVAYTIRFIDDHDTNNSQSFYTFLLEAKANPKCAIALAEVEVDSARQRFTFTATDVKWYESYPDVDSHMALISLAEDWACQVTEGKLNCRIGSVFVRIGEDVNDVEERHQGDYNYDWIQVERKITMDW
jgi:hypothetical protein